MVAVALARALPSLRMRVRLAVWMMLLAAPGCGGAAPLMHPAHPMREGEVTVGGGFGGRLVASGGAIAAGDDHTRALEQGATAPGLAPWIGGRVGLDGQFDAGLTYTARSVRVDGRRAFDLGDFAVSVGLGASGVLPKRDDALGLRVGGGGGDLPLLIGWRSRADIYALWLGVRGGFEMLRGQRTLLADGADPNLVLFEDVSGWHVQAGGLIGLRVGFRHVFATVELAPAMHWAEAQVGDSEVSIRQFTLSPAGALVARFE